MKLGGVPFIEENLKSNYFINHITANNNIGFMVYGSPERVKT